jgi:hypothetical protein
MTLEVEERKSRIQIQYLKITSKHFYVPGNRRFIAAIEPSQEGFLTLRMSKREGLSS